jgi:poly(A)-specific ribonuclease
MSAKLGAEREKQSAKSDDPGNKSLSPVKEPNGHLQDSVRDGREKALEPIPLPPVADLSLPVSASLTGRQKRKNKKKNKRSPETRFQTKNIFESLREMSINPEDNTEDVPESTSSEIDFNDAENTKWDEQPVAEAGNWANEIYVQDKSGWVPIEQSERHAMELMPKFDDAFWSEFGNTLRVFGTEESVLKIKEW